MTARLVTPLKSKRCRKCDVVKPREEFPPSRQTSDGRSSWCRLCHNAATRAWRSDRKAA